LNNEHKARASDLELFGQLKAFSWLSYPDKSHLVSALEIANFTKREVILRESELACLLRAHSSRWSGQPHLPER
jgi:hypothetical protein